MRITAIILAAGWSKRFKGNKLLQRYKGKPILLHVVEQVAQIDFSEIIVVTAEEEVVSLIKASKSLREKIKVVENTKRDLGISYSIRLGILASSSCEGYMFFVGDTPCITHQTIERMKQAFVQLDSQEAPILCPIHKGQRGNPVIFSSQYREQLLELEGDTGGKQIIQRHLERVRFFEIEDAKELMDIDTKAAYKELLNQK